jgi:hypothetical protein
MIGSATILIPGSGTYGAKIILVIAGQMNLMIGIQQGGMTTHTFGETIVIYTRKRRV